MATTKTDRSASTSDIECAAVALFVYRRPDLARSALASIRRIQPKRLYFIADGAKNASEIKACELSRQLVDEVDWPCEIRSDLARVNLGCARRIASGVEWVFEHEDRAIFLEDDCIADSSFFPFCHELLERYESEERVMMITGFNVLSNSDCGGNSYWFSNLGSSWGWATWRRAWAHFDLAMEAWRQPAVQNQIRRLLDDDEVFVERARLFNEVAASRLSSWAIPWNFACLLRGACCAVPALNLIANVGFGCDSTHHKRESDPNAGIPLSSLEFPLTHPGAIAVEKQFDRQWNRKALGVEQAPT
jgi:hypothetical protein